MKIQARSLPGCMSCNRKTIKYRKTGFSFFGAKRLSAMFGDKKIGEFVEDGNENYCLPDSSRAKRPCDEQQEFKIEC